MVAEAKRPNAELLEPSRHFSNEKRKNKANVECTENTFSLSSPTSIEGREGLSHLVFIEWCEWPIHQWRMMKNTLIQNGT